MLLHFKAKENTSTLTVMHIYSILLFFKSTSLGIRSIGIQLSEQLGKDSVLNVKILRITLVFTL